MLEIIYRVRFPGNFGMGCKSSKFHVILVHERDGKYRIVEGVHESYCDQYERPYTVYDSKTEQMFETALEAEDCARKRFLELLGSRVAEEGADNA